MNAACLQGQTSATRLQGYPRIVQQFSKHTHIYIQVRWDVRDQIWRVEVQAACKDLMFFNDDLFPDMKDGIRSVASNAIIADTPETEMVTNVPALTLLRFFSDDSCHLMTMSKTVFYVNGSGKSR